MSDAYDAAVNELFDHLLKLEDQVVFLITVWNKNDENYSTLARAVLKDVRASIKTARKYGEDELVRALSRMTAVISFLDEHHVLLSTWSGSTSSYRGKVRSVVSGGLPGHGNRS